MKGVGADAVDQLGEISDVPDGEIGGLAGFEGAGVVLEAEGACTVYCDPTQTFGDGEAEEGRTHVRGEQDRGQWRGAGVAIGGERDRDSRVAQCLDGRTAFLAGEVEGAGEESGDGAGCGHGSDADPVEMFEMVGGEGVVARC